MTADVAAQRFVDIMRTWIGDPQERAVADTAAMVKLEDLYLDMLREGRTG